VAGLLADAQDAAAGGEALLERVVEVGQAYLELRAEQEPRFVPEVLFNLGVAEHRLGRLGGAAKRFLEVATRFPNFEQGARSAVIAVQLAEQQYRRAPDDESGKSLYGDCLAALVDGFPDTEDARYHRFFYAQLLEESKRYDEAADQYAVIESGHEHHLLSTFRHIRCRALGLGVLARSDQTDSLEIQRRVNEFLSARRHFVTVATGAKGQQAVMTPEQLDRLSATAEVIEAEVLVLPAVNRSGQAILALERFEESHPGQSALTARVWRVRVLAYKRLDRLEEAAQALPAYVQADPDGAGETLQALYESVAQDADALAVATETERAMAKAQTALLLAEQIDTWARQSDAGPQDGLLRAVTVQLAEANLRAQHYPKARELFESFLGVADGRAPQAALIDARTRFGYAESLYHLGEFTQALPHFNHLAVRLPMDDSLRWKSLLRDLQCRTALGEPAEGIVRVIRQQQFLDSRLGGPVLSPKFLALLRENERR
jgi:tetratricopeptide (TPR) repeat protein